MNPSELIASLRAESDELIKYQFSHTKEAMSCLQRLHDLSLEAADALQAMEFALDATATPKSLTTKREKVILLTGAQNENSLLRAQLATQSLRLEDANGLLRYVADQRDAALGKLQALERVPMTEETALKFAHRRATTYTHRSDPHYSGYAFVPYTLMDFVRDLEAHHKITPPESKG